MPEVIWRLLSVAYHTAAVYAFLILGFRFLARRLLGELNQIDLVVIVLMGSAVETTMVHADTSLEAGIVSAGTLLATNYFISRWCFKSLRFRHFVGGMATVLVQDGKPIESAMKAAGISNKEIEEAIRERNVDDIKNVRYAVMEADGEITVVPKSLAAI